MIFYSILSQIVVNKEKKILCLLRVNAILYSFYEYSSTQNDMKKYIRTYLLHSSIFNHTDDIKINVILRENDKLKIEDGENMVYDIVIDEEKKKIQDSEMGFEDVYQKVSEELNLRMWEDYDLTDKIYEMDNDHFSYLVDKYYGDNFFDEEGNEKEGIDDVDEDKLREEIIEKCKKEWDEYYTPNLLEKKEKEINLRVHDLTRLIYQYPSNLYKSLNRFLVNKYLTQHIKSYIYTDKNIFKLKGHLYVKKYRYEVECKSEEFEKMNIEFDIYEKDGYSKLFTCKVIKTHIHYKTFPEYELNICDLYNDSIVSKETAKEIILNILDNTSHRIFVGL